MTDRNECVFHLSHPFARSIVCCVTCAQKESASVESPRYSNSLLKSEMNVNNLRIFHNWRTMQPNLIDISAHNHNIIISKERKISSFHSNAEHENALNRLGCVYFVGCGPINNISKIICQIIMWQTSKATTTAAAPATMNQNLNC